ncbi:MAG TPA: plastocyanin/azurin family copper-binding protein [Gemmatimonadaceae bacterium]|nr:plastocyanin/azurin family copper-binding protein [Gemmatimonadaceae bacterium]
MRTWRILAASTLAAALAACGGSGSGYSTSPSNPTPPPTTTGGGPPPSSNVVTLGDASFSPAALTVSSGTTVTWQWTCSNDGYGGTVGCVTHTVTFDDGSNIASAAQDSGTFNRTFNTAGTFKYHCAIHGSSMSGEVIVK